MPTDNNTTQNPNPMGTAAPVTPDPNAPVSSVPEQTMPADQTVSAAGAPTTTTPTVDATMGAVNPVEEKKEETGEMPGGTPPMTPPTTPGM